MPKNILASALSKYCLKNDVILAPGNAFSQADGAEHFMRFNVAQCIDKHIFDVLEAGIKEIRKHDHIDDD